MHGFNKIVLSRKGYDSSTGGDWSLFDLNGRKYIVLPIPADEEGEVPISNPLKYEEIKIKSNYLSGCDAPNLKDLIKQTIGKEPIIKKKIQGRICNIPSWHAHFDPWLGHCCWLQGESNHSIGAFGQVGGAQTVLEKRGVGKGSLFLFFSRFKPISKARESMFGFSPDHLNKGLYFIYAWLRVGEVIDKFEKIDGSQILGEKEKKELKSRHPHATEDYFTKYENKNGGNTIYIAAEHLFSDSKDVAGCSYFPKLTEKLLLTATDSAQQSKKFIASRWKMPPGFSYQTCRSYLTKPEKWNMDLVETRGRGQEFVFKESEEFCDWLDELLQEIQKQS